MTHRSTAWLHIVREGGWWDTRGLVDELGMTFRDARYALHCGARDGVFVRETVPGKRARFTVDETCRVPQNIGLKDLRAALQEGTPKPERNTWHP